MVGDEHDVLDDENRGDEHRLRQTRYSTSMATDMRNLRAGRHDAANRRREHTDRRPSALPPCLVVMFGDLSESMRIRDRFIPFVLVGLRMLRRSGFVYRTELHDMAVTGNRLQHMGAVSVDGTHIVANHHLWWCLLVQPFDCQGNAAKPCDRGLPLARPTPESACAFSTEANATARRSP